MIVVLVVVVLQLADLRQLSYSLVVVLFVIVVGVVIVAATVEQD